MRVFEAILAMMVIRPTATALTFGGSLFTHPPCMKQINGAGRFERTDTVLNFNINEIEAKASAAADAWDVYATAFLDSKEGSELEHRFADRADVSCIRLGGSSNPTRSRYLFSHPDLGLDATSMASEYCAILRVDNANLMDSDRWPNVLSRIGVDMENVGDIFVVDGDAAFLAVAPEIAKTCSRLLPKELPGAGVMVSTLGAGEDMPEGGELQSMELKRLDRREQKRK